MSIPSFNTTKPEIMEYMKHLSNSGLRSANENISFLQARPSEATVGTSRRLQDVVLGIPTRARPLSKYSNLDSGLSKSRLEVETNLLNQSNKPKHHIKLECSRTSKRPKLTQHSSTNQNRPVHVASTSTFSGNSESYKHSDNNKVIKECKFGNSINKQSRFKDKLDCKNSKTTL